VLTVQGPVAVWCVIKFDKCCGLFVQNCLASMVLHLCRNSFQYSKTSTVYFQTQLSCFGYYTRHWGGIWV